MPIGNITQTMSTISPPPHRGVDVQTVFVNKQEDFQDHLADITIDELNTLKDQLNTRIGEINSTATTMNGYATSASSSATTATTKAGEASTSASGALTSRNQAETFKNDASTSATKASQWADNNYNVEVETGKYSAKHWSTVAENATSGKIDKVTSTDNAIVRFDGTTGAVQNSSVTVDDNGNIGSGTQSFNGFGGSGFKNYIINGNFDVWQYGTSQTSIGYGSDDRWYNSNGGSTKTHSQIACTDTERALFNASYFSRTVVSSVVGAGNYAIKRTAIEDVTKLAGKTITVSFWAKADSNKNIWLEFRQTFGTGGSPSTQVIGIYGQAIALTSTWQKKTITLTLPSIVGKTLGTDGVHTSSTEVQFWFDVGSAYTGRIPTGIQQSGTFNIAQVQLEEGSVATPFEQRPYGLELSLCQRYLPTATGFYNGHAATTGETYITIKYPVTPRVSPTGLSTTSAGSVYYTNLSSPITNIIFFAGGIDSGTIKVTPTGTPLTIGQGVMVGLPKILFTGCEL